MCTSIYFYVKDIVTYSKRRASFAAVVYMGRNM